MNKQSLFLLFVVLILIGCTDVGNEVGEQPLYEREPLKKDGVAEFFHPYDFTPITLDHAYIQVLDWYDNENILFLTEDDKGTSLQIHHIYNGLQREFFSSDHHILHVNSNKDKSMYAISVEENDRISLYIVNESGEILFNVAEIGSDISSFWNPYLQDQILIVSYLPNWEFELFHLVISDGELKKVDLDQTYLQWIDDKTIGYLKWSWSEPSFSAPLVFYDVSTEEKKQFLDDVIAFFAFSNQLMVTLSVDSIYDMDTIYTFYRNEEKLSEMAVPILDTFSEQWWIPYHDYSDKQDLFYYYRPLYSGTFIDYADSYELVAFHVSEGMEEVILELDDHSPIKSSPNGKRLLYGNQYEYIVDIRNKEKYPIIHFE